MSDNSCKKVVTKKYKKPLLPSLPLQPIDVAVFRKQCLDAHNKYRAKHCSPPLTMCSEMNAFAMQWAQNLARLGSVKSRHYFNYGENLYRADEINVPGDLPVKRWYEEIRNYEFATSKFEPSVSHFTQVIWKNTKEIGIGVVRNGLPEPDDLALKKKMTSQPQKIVRIIQGPPPVLGQINVEDFRTKCLEAHNSYRAKHGCPPLKINEVLNKAATKWAENLAKRKKLEHQQNNEYGENLYMADNVEVPGDLPVKRWYDEIEQYNFETSKFSPNVGHFTQVVWKATTDVGIGVIRQANATYVVAEYNPPGNIQGEFKAMVPRKIN